MITKEQIFGATDNGKDVIEHYYPQSAPAFSGRGRNFKIRDDDKTPSCTVFRKDGIWFIQDKGGTDTKARTAIQLVMREEGLKYAQAIEWIAEKFAPALCENKGYQVQAAAPVITEVPPQDELTVQVRESGEFTERELQMLGYKITPEVCEELLLKPVDYYITAKNAKGKSYMIASNESYPIYFYDYGSWGKIYCPLGQTRFLYVGQKPDNFIFGERDFIKRMEDAKNNIYPGLVKPDPEDKDGEIINTTWKELIICSGPSDALNVKNAGYHVCWLNSETADLKDYEFIRLQKIAKKIYILYDIDETGIANMYRLALRYLDLNIIRLPEELKRFRDRKGKPCKDAKDFFMYFRRPENQNPHKLFGELVKLSGGLKFWEEKRDKEKNLKGYDIDNEQLYSFLEASGFHRIATTANPKGFTFCRLLDNVVQLINEDAISAQCSSYLLEYLRTHAQYYSKQLANSIHRSKQVSKSSLEKLSVVEPEFNTYDDKADYIFFNNGIFRISAAGITKEKAADCDFMTYDNKIIRHDLKIEEPFFDVEYSEEYEALQTRLSSLTPSTPEWKELKRQVDTVDDLKRYKLKILRNDCSFMQFVYNTGRNFWRKEEEGLPLSEQEQAETDLHFINKAMALGYFMSKHKKAGQPYALYAMETEQSEEGTHLGGTGKSLFMTSTEQMRKQLFINGQELKADKTDFMLQGVVKGITDSVYFDDLNAAIDLHRFMPMITGKMVVNPKNRDAFILEYNESPKVAFTSNHAIKQFDASLRRRTWFTAFTDYYHSDDPDRGLRERSPYTQFGKNLIQDYTEEEMNAFYNFMLNCIQMWHKLNVRVQPPMKQIEKRNLQRAITDEFIWWCEDYFTEDKLNCLINKQEAFEDYKKTLSPRIAEVIKMQTFKTKLMQYCRYKEWVFNPEKLLISPTDKDRNDIRKKENGKLVYYFYIDTVKSENLPVSVILGKDEDGGAGDADSGGGLSDDVPIFGE